MTPIKRALVMLCVMVQIAYGDPRPSTEVTRAEQLQRDTQQLAEKAEAVIRLTERLGRLDGEIKQKADEYERLVATKSREADRVKQERDKLEEEKVKLAEEIAERGRQLIELQAKLNKTTEDLVSVTKQLADIKATLGKFLSTGATGLDEIIEVRIGDKVVTQGRNLAVLADAEKCTIEIKLKNSMAGTLEGNGIRAVALRGEDERVIPLKRNAANDLRRTSATWTSAEVCKYNRASIANHEQLTLTIDAFDEETKTPLQAVYRMRYERPAWEGEIGISTYFGTNNIKASEALFVAFPALQLGARFNIPFGTQNSDFYIGTHVLIGGGFVFKTEASSMGIDTEEDNPTKALTLFAGGALTIGRYLGFGYAYDILNKEHLVLLTPGSLLSQAIFKF